MPPSCQDPINRARSLMQLPADPVLADDKGNEHDEDSMPAAKRPKNGHLVAGAILGQPMRDVPPQTVLRI